jgi:hypothetical protein
MAQAYLRKTLTGWEPADDASREVHRKHKLGEVYRADVVKPRSYQHHKLCMALLQLTYSNQERYASFEQFRKAVAIAAGHCETLVTLDGEMIQIPGSLSYEALDEVAFTKVFAAMMTVCCGILGVAAPQLEAEVSRYADEHYGRAAA